MKGRDDMRNEFIVPTGKIVKEYLDEYNVTQKDLSARIGMSEKHISNVLNGNNRLTEDFALKLEKVIQGVPASYWLNYESKYRESLARQEELLSLDNQDIKEISKKFHFKETFAGLNLSIFEQAIQMLKLLKISNFTNFDTAYKNLAVDFMEDGGEKESIAIWLNLCESEIECQNSDIDGIPYSEKNLEKSLAKFKLLSCNDNTSLSINSCRKLCNKLGIYLVFHEPITNSKVRGALTTYKYHPAIYLSGRFKTHDNIWFAFIHEIGHLLMHYNKKDIIVSFDDDPSNKETSANAFARDFFVDPNNYKEFVNINKGSFTEESIRQFAKSQETIPIMVVAMLKHDGIVGYDKFSWIK